MNHIVKPHLMKIGNLDAISYFHFILKEALRLSLLSTSQMEKIQVENVGLLTKQLERYTGGQSSSVTVETAQSIQQSIFYTIGIYLKTLPNADVSLEVLKENSLHQLYSNGKHLIEMQFKHAEELLLSIQQDCLSTDHFAYNDTIQNGLSMFFSSYDVDYGAHETPASIDYPLSNDKMVQTGVEYIYGYLQKLQLENEFCNCFSTHDIHCLMRGYDLHYKELLFNIFELVFTNAIGSLLTGRNELQLQMESYDRQYLQHDLSILSKKQLDELVQEVTTSLCSKLTISNPQLESHIKRSMISLKSRLKNALEINGLDLLFLPLKEDVANPIIQFEDKKKLSDERFRDIAEDIRECGFISDKIAILQRELPSIADLMDLLEGDCFFGDEFLEVFHSLENPQLALLTKHLPLDPADFSFLFEESDKEWHYGLHLFLDEIDSERKTAILALAGMFEFSENE